MSKARHEAELDEVSFTPSINKISSMIFNMKQQSDMPCHDRLNSYGAVSLAKKDRIRVLKESVEDSRFDYQPKIDKISRIINDEREKSVSQATKPRYD